MSSVWRGQWCCECDDVQLNRISPHPDHVGVSVPVCHTVNVLSITHIQVMWYQVFPSPLTEGLIGFQGQGKSLAKFSWFVKSSDILTIVPVQMSIFSSTLGYQLYTTPQGLKYLGSKYEKMESVFLILSIEADEEIHITLYRECPKYTVQVAWEVTASSSHGREWSLCVGGLENLNSELSFGK